MTGTVTPFNPEVGEIWLGNGKENRPFKIGGDIKYDLTNIFARRSNQGDPSPDDHPVFTSWIQATWTGGMGINKFNPATDQGKYWDSSCDVLYPGALQPGPLTIAYHDPLGLAMTCFPLGDMYGENYLGHFHVSWGQRLYAYNPVSDSFTLKSSLLHAVPVNKWCVYKIQTGPDAMEYRAFIPYGLDGYDAWDGVNIPDYGIGGVVHAMDFAIYNDSLFCLTYEGQILRTTKNPLVIGDWELMATIPDNSTPQHIISYKDFSGNPCLYVITDRNVYALDFTNKILFLTDLVFPKHPHQGESVAVKNGALNVTVGIGMHRYDTNTIAAEGMDGGDGLPLSMRGFISSLAPAYNGLYALVQGAQLVDDQVEDFQNLEVGNPDQSLDFPIPLTRNYLALKSDYGWSKRAEFLGSIPTSVHVSDAMSHYAVWFGGGSQLFKQVLPTTYYNPRDLANEPVPREPNAYHESSWYYYGWEGQPKIAKQIEFSSLQAYPDCFVKVSVKYDRDENPWEELGIIDGKGEYVFKVGQSPWKPFLNDGSKFYQGVPHQRIKLLLEFTNNSGDLFKCAKIEWHQVIIRRYLRPQRQFIVPITLDNENKNGYTPVQNAAFLEALAIQQTGIIFQMDDIEYICDLVALSGRNKSGRNRNYVRTVSLVESFDLGPEDAPWERSARDHGSTPDPSE